MGRRTWGGWPPWLVPALCTIALAQGGCAPEAPDREASGAGPVAEESNGRTQPVEYGFYRGPGGHHGSIRHGLLARTGHYSDSGAGSHECALDGRTALTQTTDVLVNDLVVAGAPRLHLWATSNVDEVEVRVVVEEEVPVGGGAAGAAGASAQEGDGAEFSTVWGEERQSVDGLVPGVPREVVVELDSASHVFPRGARMRVRVTCLPAGGTPGRDARTETGGQPGAEGPANSVASTGLPPVLIYHTAQQPSRLILPIVP